MNQHSECATAASAMMHKGLIGWNKSIKALRKTCHVISKKEKESCSVTLDLPYLPISMYKEFWHCQKFESIYRTINFISVTSLILKCNPKLLTQH